MSRISLSRVSPDAVEAVLAKILASQHFAHSGQLLRFLEFTVTQTLAGNASSLKEYAIGTSVFGRKESFDPRTDGIVRVQAVALRSRLKEYYTASGLNDPVIIEYRKGSYAPVLRYRSDVDSPAKPVVNSPSGPASIAVLPFVNMSSDPENEYFSDGLTEELISTITNIKSLRVVARTSVFRFKGKSEDIRKIGAELSADMVLEGSVRKSGDRLRITAQLIDVASGYHTWSRTYRVEIKDLFAVQEEIALAIANTLSESPRGVPKRPTACYGKLARGELMPKARVAAEKAMELNESLAEAHVSLAAVRAIYDWDWAGSEKEFRRAIELDPDCAPAHQWCGVLCLMPQGRLKEAETAIRRALDLDPLSPAINTSLGHAYYVQGRHDDAIAYLEKALETDPRFYLAHWWLGVIYFQRSMLLKAFAQFRQAGALSKRDWSDAARFTYGHALVGKRGKARAMLEELTRISGKQYFSPVMIAAIHVTLGETDAAFEWLDKAYLLRDAWLVWLSVDRRFDSVRQDARFASLLNKIGIAEHVSALPA